MILDLIINKHFDGEIPAYCVLLYKVSRKVVYKVKIDNAIEYIKENTDIPVPRVYASGTIKNNDDAEYIITNLYFQDLLLDVCDKTIT